MTQSTRASTEKYTAEQTAQLLSIWQAFCENCPDWATIDREKADKKIEELAQQFQKKTRSIIAKLVRHNHYTAKTAAKGGKSDTKNKLEISQAIGRVLNLSEPETESLSTAGKQALTKIMGALAGSVPVETLTPEQQASKNESIKSFSELLPLDPETLRDLGNLKRSSLSNLFDAIISELHPGTQLSD